MFGKIDEDSDDDDIGVYEVLWDVIFFLVFQWIVSI